MFILIRLIAKIFQMLLKKHIWAFNKLQFSGEESSKGNMQQIIPAARNLTQHRDCRLHYHINHLWDY